MRLKSNWLLTSLLLLNFVAPVALADIHKPEVVIIIDDLGNNYTRSLQAVNLPGPVTCSILPDVDYSYTIDKLAKAQNKQIILHVPMQPIRPIPLGPGGLTVNMPQAQFDDVLAGDLQSVPDAEAISNHMGSLLTQDRQDMNWLMNFLASRHLDFMDSLTINRSVAYQTARADGVPAAYRSVFLDDVINENAVAAQFQILVQDAKARGIAVAIGHPNDVTLSYLQSAIPRLAAEGITLVPLSDAMKPEVATPAADMLAVTTPTSTTTPTEATITEEVAPPPPPPPAFYQEPMVLSVQTTLPCLYWMV